MEWTLEADRTLKRQGASVLRSRLSGVQESREAVERWRNLADRLSKGDVAGGRINRRVLRRNAVDGRQGAAPQRWSEGDVRDALTLFRECRRGVGRRAKRVDGRAEGRVASRDSRKPSKDCAGRDGRGGFDGGQEEIDCRKISAPRLERTACDIVYPINQTHPMSVNQRLRPSRQLIGTHRKSC